ncbi:MAG: peptidase M16 [Candidatus Nitrohelix vancouverensis]|uniref:Protease 3 n=1 Tax=Candidatus Nitrohelix vancouverensis TaxID=2705534 RepID=A0A7T0C381_9BACT|nr:MAG: peptidase M16 [Candidatus Nitrohelix vancouverensis]
MTRFLFVLWIILLLGTAHASERKTQTFKLDNGLEALLVFDPEVHRSAAALGVGTGMLYDPEDKQGLAHYLEHMLFLGTKKFPVVGSYKEYLDANSGASNAYTSSDVTNYFFEVSHDAFEGALDRFSDFFKSPLFDEKYSEREVNAVSSEHDKNQRSDGWRLSRVQNMMVEPGHPLAKFGTGNKETLAGDNGPALRAFFKKYYAASNMRLALISNIPLPQQESLARKYFEGIEDRPVVLPEVSPDYRKPLKDKYRLLKVKSIKDLRSLSVEFPTIRLSEHLESKPASIVGSVIGYEGKGSLLSKLKEEGLALGLSAGGGNSHPNINSFEVGVSLTPKGAEEYETVLERIFAYFEMLRAQGMQEYTYRENEAMAEINFKYKDPDEGMGFVAGQAALMFDYKLDEVETLPFLFKKYDPEAYQALLETLRPENAMVTLQTNSLETDQVEKYYGAEYSMQQVGGPAFQRLKNPAKVEGIAYPEKNDFIPYNLEKVEEEPHLVWDDEMGRVWFKFDNRFKQPKVFLSFRIETPLVYDTVDHLMTAKMYDMAIHEGLNELVYPIQMAGLSYGLGLTKKGINLSIGGYSERVEDLLALITKNLKTIKIDEQKFNDLKEVLLRDLDNRKLGQSYARGGYYGALLWLKKHYTEEQKIEALQKVTYEVLKRYAGKVYERIHLTGMAHGNWNDAKVRQSVGILLKELGGKALPEKDRFKIEVERMKPAQTVVFSKQVLDNNNSISYHMPMGDKSIELQAVASLISSIIKSDFYTQMRTNQQLGYIVWSFDQRMEDQQFLKFIIQSATYSPFELQTRVEAWMKESGKIFDSLTDEEFEKHRAGQIISLEKQGDSIGEVLEDLFYLATEEDADFQFKKRLIAAVEKVKREDVVAMAKKLLTTEDSGRLAILMRSSEFQGSVPDGVISDVDSFKVSALNEASANAHR